MARIDAEQNLAKVSALLANGVVNGPKQISEVLGISIRTANRALAKVRPALADAERKRAEWANDVGAICPNKQRAARLGELITQNDQAMVSLKAIMYADNVLGVGPVQEQQHSERTQGAMFALPPGTRVLMQVGTNDECGDKVGSTKPANNVATKQVDANDEDAN